MSEFEAYNRETNQWEIFPLSKLSEIEEDERYSNIAVNEQLL